MRLLFLNQYFPPDPAPTGVLLRELASRLESEGHAVDFVAARQAYAPGQAKGGRMRREFLALGRMLLDGLRRPRPDVVVSATSPPCLAFIAALLALWHRARHIHWVMDLYPEIAVALGEIKPGALAGFLEWLMGWSYRRAALIVVLDEDMAARLRRHGVEPEILRPWVFAPVLERLAALPPPTPSGEETAGWTWIYSGNLGRAHEWQTLLDAQAIIEHRGSPIRLLIQGGGPSWLAAQEQARILGLERCVWRPYVAEESLPASLLECQACVVTQRPEAQGLLWPSKLGLVLALPRPILWIGPREGAIASLLRAFPHAGVFAPGQATEIAEWLLALHDRAPAVPASQTLDPEKHRTESLTRWSATIRRLS